MKKKSRQKLPDSKNLKPVIKKLNPFEVHINRKKYDVLGMKSKSERGLPGVSRAKSLKKRKGTLLQEYRLKDKKNMFLDRRIGERNRAMTAEDKVLARFAAERMRFHSKQSIYNLGDDMELTHKGQTLTEIEKFDDPKSEDEDEDEGGGKLDSGFVEDAHFGGGMFTKVEGEPKSRKDLIDQLIAESIKRKAEKQKLKQQTLDLTQKLDSEWKELLPLVTASKKSKLDSEPNDKKDDKFSTYDIMSKKLKFEVRGKPSDRLKSEEEIAKEEKEKLEKLEKERIQRMKGEAEVKTFKHRSADDLDDGFDLNNEPETYLTYKNGELNIEGKDIGSNFDEDKTKNVNSHVGNNTNTESDDYDDDDDDNDNDNGDDNVDIDGDGEKNLDEYSNTCLDAEQHSDSGSDNLSDLKDSDEDDDKLFQENTEQKEKDNSAVVAIKEKSNALTNETCDKETKKDNLEKEKAMEAARNELPYTFEIPKEYEEFENLMKKYNSDFQAVIIERMIKCHHPSLKENFKGDLDLLYTLMLQHLQDCASDDSLKDHCFTVLDRLAPWFFDLVQWSPQNCSSSLIEVIREKYQDFLKTPKSYPPLDTLIFLKLVSILFPTSDYRHPVVTPSLIFMQQMLFQCKVRTSVDLSRGLFIATLLLEYLQLSKRFVPEAISFLHGVLRLAHPRNSDIPVLPPFDWSNQESFNLVLLENSRSIECTELCTNDLIHVNSSEQFKINATSLAVTLLSRFFEFWNEDQPSILLFDPFVKLLDVNWFGDNIKDKVEEVLIKIMNLKKKKLKMLAMEKKKPMPLKLYEPRIEEVYTLKKYRPMGKKKAERAKLLHKYKREMKGALREIRKDRSFIAKLKYKETVKSDMERQRKVRELLGAAAEQAGELNKIQRKKKY